MINCILSFVLCSGLLLGVYHLILKNESFYRFNRFFLLFGILFSAAVPFIKIRLPEKIRQMESGVFKNERPVIQQTYTAVSVHQPGLQAKAAIIESPAPVSASQSTVVQTAPGQGVDWSKFLVTLYILPVLVLLIRFARNSYFIGTVIKRHSIVQKQNVNLVLIDDNVTPHSFLRYIFLNKQDYDAGLIEPQIICHEQAHISQLHSIDVLIAELLQIFCWFNPFIPLYKRAIQLNHEFLADDAVTKTFTDIAQYQHLLLAKASLPGSMPLTSQFNYLTIKNRLIMMTKTTSTKMTLVKGAMLLPLITGTLIIFSHKVYAQSNSPAKQFANISSNKKTNDKIVPSKPAGDAVVNEYQAILSKYYPKGFKGQITRNKFTGLEWETLKDHYLQMNQQQRDSQWIQFVPASSLILEKARPTAKQLAEWQNAKVYGVWVNAERVKNTELSKYKPSDFDYFGVSNLTPLARKNDGFNCQIELMTRAFYADYKKRTIASTNWFMFPNRARINKSVKL